MPFPEPVRSSDGTWTQEIHVCPSRPDNLPDATVEIILDDPYLTGTYDVVRDNPAQALVIRELFGAEGCSNSRVFRMGLVDFRGERGCASSLVEQRPRNPLRYRLLRT